MIWKSITRINSFCITFLSRHYTFRLWFGNWSRAKKLNDAWWYFKCINKTFFIELTVGFISIVSIMITNHKLKCDNMVDSLAIEKYLLYYTFVVLMKHLMEPIQQMLWLQALVDVHIFLLEYSNQLVKLILHGSLLTIKIAKWNLEVGRIMDLR